MKVIGLSNKFAWFCSSIIEWACQIILHDFALVWSTGAIKSFCMILQVGLEHLWFKNTSTIDKSWKGHQKSFSMIFWKFSTETLVHHRFPPHKREPFLTAESFQSKKRNQHENFNHSALHCLLCFGLCGLCYCWSLVKVLWKVNTISKIHRPSIGS